MQLIDSHAHLLSSRYDEDRDALMAELAQVMEAVVECASEPGDFPRVVQLAEQYPFIYGAVGVHPEAIDQWTADIPAQLAAYLGSPKIVALGEVGLDYYWEPDKKQAQKAALEAQIAVAKAAGKPVILHNREATADLYDLLQANRGFAGVVHCFSDGPDIAKKALDMGLYIGFGGILTFKNAGVVAEAAAYAPMDRILLETDCPYLAPVPKRGKRNRPDYTAYTAAKLAELKGISTEQVIETANANARVLFGL